jgi:hypothetical protein
MFGDVWFYAITGDDDKEMTPNVEIAHEIVRRITRTSCFNSKSSDGTLSIEI